MLKQLFCLGENAEKYPEWIREILSRGHAVGNHGYRHLNGWKISAKDFRANYIKEKLFWKIFPATK